MPKESLQTLTDSMYYVLLSLYEPRCGIEIMDAVAEISHGKTVIGPGTLYTMLAKFEENGLIAPASETGFGKRKNYRITEKGNSVLRAEYERLAERVEDGRRILEGYLLPETALSREENGK